MRHRYYCFVVAVAVSVFFTPVSAAAQEEFYRGKTLRFIVGYAAGGGYDLITRITARHISKHIPGHPTAIVENMAGAGSLVAANHVYSVAKGDGLTIGVIGSGLVLQQALRLEGIKFDAQRFGWIGAPSVDAPVCGIMGFTGMKSLEDVLGSKKVIQKGSQSPGTTPDDLPKLMIGLMNANFSVIAGYKGTSAIRAAMERREVDGACWTWDSMRTTARAMLDAQGDGKLIPYLIEGRFSDPEVKHLPQFTEVIRGEDNLAAFKAWLNPYKFFRPLVFPPKTPRERLETLREAYRLTLLDREFQADAKKAQMDVEYVSGQQIDAYVKEIISTSEGAKKKLRSLLGK